MDQLAPLMEGHDPSQVVLTSALTREGIPQLVELLMAMAPSTLERIVLEIPPQRGDVLAMLHREGHVESHATDPETGVALVTALIPRKYVAGLVEFLPVPQV
jgi:GTP-binding protein HflX